jgi:hypothetical protein
LAKGPAHLVVIVDANVFAVDQHGSNAAAGDVHFIGDVSRFSTDNVGVGNVDVDGRSPTEEPAAEVVVERILRRFRKRSSRRPGASLFKLFFFVNDTANK